MENLIVAAHQPNFLPYPGLFYKIYKCEKFIFVDDVQFSTRHGISHNNNNIKTAQGETRIRVPVKKNSNSLINEVTIDYTNRWIEKLERTIYLSYGKSKYYQEVSDWLFGVLERRYEFLSELNMQLIVDISKKAKLGDNFDVASKYDIPGKKEDLVVNLVEFFNGTVYYSGTGAAAYLHDSTFKTRGIRLIYSDYKPPIYPQMWGKFLPNLSMIDYLFNCGFSNPFLS